MSSAKSATTNADAVRALRVGVIGAGVMGMVIMVALDRFGALAWLAGL